MWTRSVTRQPQSPRSRLKSCAGSIPAARLHPRSRRKVLAVAVGVQLAGLRRLALSRWGLTFALVGVAGIALRIWVYRSALGTPNADEAVVGLMTRHVIDGQFTTFYWGQAYGGSQEAILTAPVFLIAGSSWLALRGIPKIGRESCRERG